MILCTCSPQDAPDDLPFDTFTDNRDGNVYKMVTIGDQIWMAENLAYLPNVVGPAPGSTSTPYYYVFGYDGSNVSVAKATNNYNTYGVLYNWSAAIVACPYGWHLPSDAEWTQLVNYLANSGHNYDGSTGGGGAKIGKSMAKKSGWSISSIVGSVGNIDYPEYRNKSGFSALPGGARFFNYGQFSNSNSGLWWTSTEYMGTTLYALLWGLDYDDSAVNDYYNSKVAGFSVRCVKN